VISGVVYLVLLATLVVRVRSTDAPPPEPIWPQAHEPLWLTRVHHWLFAALLLGAPVERIVLGGATEGRVAGACVFAAGVALYRLAGATLGDALSPFTEPRAAAPLVTAGLYRWIRHPMYLSQAMIAVGAPLSLGSRHVVFLAVPAAVILALRVLREEDALARTFPEYARYAARTKRLVPFLY
jgi:protein-S-isoprenylcysteine O-methyltransferase Ste14